MVSDPSTDSIVRWTEDGSAFVVLDEFAFARQLLPLYFRHKNFSSFIRQLNFYNFKKRQVDGKYIRLQHPYFKRGQLQLLQLIKRKSTHDAHSSVRATLASLSSQVKELKGQYDDLFKIQQQILYIFSRYMRANPIPRSLAGRERLMLQGEGEDGEGGLLSGAASLMPHPNVELVEEGDDDEDNDLHDATAQHDGDDGDVRISELGDGDAEAFDDGGEVGGFEDDEEAGDGEEDLEEKNELTAQAFAELQNLQEIIDQMPGKQEFLSSIPPLPSPTERPSKRRARATSPPLATNPATSSASSSMPATTSKHDAFVYEPSSPPPAMSTFNAFPATDASVALPPLYPSQSYLDQQAGVVTPSAATLPAHVTSASTAARNKPKLLYSQEHYDALSSRDGGQRYSSESKQQQQHVGNQHSTAFHDPGQYSSMPYNGWSAPSEQKEHDPLSGSLYTPMNVRQSSWMPAELPPNSPHLASFLNSDDSAAEADFGSMSALGSESGEQAASTRVPNGSGGQYGSWPTYQQY